MGKRVIGIDLGTTNSAVAYYDDHLKQGVCCKNSEDEYLTASAVCIQPNGEVMVGNTARDCAIIYKDRTETQPKRKIGVCKTALSVDGKDYSPQQIDALILKSLKRDAEEELGETVEDVVITVPARFDTNRLSATKEAGEMAGFHVLDLLHEPSAIFCNAAPIVNLNGDTDMAFDLGGGTLDIVVAEIHDDSIDEKIIDGDLNLGGTDWDQAFVAYIKDTYLKNHTLSVESEQELIIKAEKAKKELSSKTQTKFSVFTDEGRVQITVTRSELDICTAHLKEKVIDVLKRVRHTMNTKNIGHLDKIILAGGATRMPQIEAALKSIFPGVTIVAKDVDRAVANGAAIYAKALMQNAQPKVFSSFDEVKIKKLNRISGRSYGVAVFNRDDKLIVSNVIMQNSPLPQTFEKTYYTRYDNHTEVAIDVYENVSLDDDVELANATLIGKCTLFIDLNLPKGSPFKVCFKLEENGTLHVRAYEEKGGTEVKTVIETKVLLNPKEFEQEKEDISGLLMVI